MSAERSWDHALRLLSANERGGWPGAPLRLCQHPKCDRAATHLGSLRFIGSKRTGRVSTRNRRLCPTHAADYAATHGLEVPA